MSAAAVPMGQPVQLDVHAPEEAKLKSMKFKSKAIDIVAAVCLVLTSFPTVYFGAGDNVCNGLMVRVVFCWLGLFGILLALAELEVNFVLDHVAVLSYRSGRVCLLFFVGSIVSASAPSEVPLAVAGGGVLTGRPVLVSFSWYFAGTGVLLLFAACYTLRLSVRSQVHKFKTGGGRGAAAAATAAGPSKEKELL